MGLMISLTATVVVGYGSFLRIKALGTAVNSHEDDITIVANACLADPPKKFMDMFKVEIRPNRVSAKRPADTQSSSS